MGKPLEVSMVWVPHQFLAADVTEVRRCFVTKLLECPNHYVLKLSFVLSHLR